jgi:peptide/nickel transport system permease protein
MTSYTARLGDIRQTWRTLARNPGGLVGFVIVSVVLLIALVGPWVVPSATQANVGAIYRPPSLEHPLGTDFQGRENWVMLVHGGREVIAIALTTGALTTLIAIAVGAFGALLGGRVDSFLITLTDTWLTVPRFILLVVVGTILELDNVWALAGLLALFSWPGLARQVRAQMLSLKKREYVEAAQVLGLGPIHIVFREMLPNMLAFIAIAFISAMIQAIYAQTGLVFLGVVPFGNNWGVMFSLAYAKNAMYQADAAWSLLVPMGAIVLFQLGLVLFSRSLEEIFNPRLRGAT